MEGRNFENKAKEIDWFEQHVTREEELRVAINYQRYEEEKAERNEELRIRQHARQRKTL